MGLTDCKFCTMEVNYVSLLGVLCVALCLVTVASQGPAVKINLNDPNGTLGDTVAADGWKDYYVVAEDEDSNIYFSVSTPSKRTDALQVYIFDGELPPIEKRSQPGAFLDLDQSSRTGRYTSVIGQCYIEKGKKYYLSVHGRTPKPDDKVGSIEDHFSYVVSSKLVPAKL